ncbi:MAG: NAD(P)-dependent alcohol dehydrogenase [Vulcanimicrobiota bacterium]
MSVSAYGNPSAAAPLAPMSVLRRETGPGDVKIDILYCGICHSDLHQARNEWKNTLYPCVPGHEILGAVSEVGAQVSKFKVGDTVGVGCMVDSCRECSACRDDEEQFCEQGAVFTYNGPDKHLGGHTFGGYSKSVTVDQNFVLHIRHTDNLQAVAPLLCAGITTYSPLKRWGAGPGKKVGVVGLGGLGHMAVKIASAMGAEVVLFTTSPSKVEDAKKLGASGVVLSNNPDQMTASAGTFDLIIDTVSANHDVNAYLSLIKRHGTMVLVGAPEDPLQIASFSVISGSKNLAGSLIGGIAETQEMLDFCAQHNIVSEIELIPINQINEAYDRLLKSDVKYRFVIDMASLG